MIGEYAKRAGINPGIIYACLSSSIIFNSLFAAIIFKQNLSLKICFGIAVVIGGVVWISIAKNAGTSITVVEEGHTLVYNEDEILKNRIIGILVAILTAFVSSIRPV